LKVREQEKTRKPRFLTVRNRLFFGTALMLLPLIAAVYVSASALDSMFADVDELMYESSRELLPVFSLRDDFQTILTLLHDETPSEDFPVDLSLLVAKVDRQFDLLQKVDFGHSEEFDAIDRAEHTWALSREQILNLRQFKRAYDPIEHELLEDALHDIRQELDVALYVSTQEMDAIMQRSLQTREVAGLKIGVTLLAALLMASLFGHFLARSILKPLARLRDGAEKFGRGELEHRIELHDRDELGEVSKAFNRMAQRLDRSLRSLQRLSTRDYLTNLLNAREFYRLLDQEIERAGRYQEMFSLLIIDADHFKQINDTYGHQSGDRVLRELAKCLREEVRNVDIPARVGGEEFAVILPSTSGEAALAIAERIRTSISEREIQLQGEEQGSVQVTVSVGMATYPHSAKDGKDLFHQADVALYNAKQGGRNRVSIN
jgi:diguanylate cyclase (GGDEF)-like protein